MLLSQSIRLGPQTLKNRMIILEPVAVTQFGKEHPKQLTIHLDHSVGHLRRIDLP